MPTIGVVNDCVGATREQAFVTIGPAHHVRRCARHPEHLDNLATAIRAATPASSHDDVVTDVRMHCLPPVRSVAHSNELIAGEATASPAMSAEVQRLPIGIFFAGTALGAGTRISRMPSL